MPNLFNRTNVLYLLVLTCLSCLVFWPGVSGSFLFDDVQNLRAMGNFGGISDFSSLRAFVFSGVSSELGRPLSMLSFAIDAQDWPADPQAFKQTNILIHIINGLLFFVVTRRLFSALGVESTRAALGAFVAAAIWLLHPIQVATVLYVVQRMTELSALFVLAGVWAYLVFRQQAATPSLTAYIGISLLIGLLTGLAVLSKENGALLPLLLLVVEFTLLSSQSRSKRWWQWSGVVLILPTLVLIVYMLLKVNDPTQAFILRDFGLYERLLTQSRVLLEYGVNFFLPLSVPNLFHDDYLTSRSLFEPLTTLFSLLSLLGMLGAALWWRKYRPVLSFALLWFFAGHLLESTVLPLEIYFEHRNYLPYIGLAFAASYYLLKLSRVPFIAVASILVVALSTVTWNYSSVWGDPTRLFETWYEQSPDSLRIRNEYAFMQLEKGQNSSAYEIFMQTQKQFPKHLGTQFFSVGIGCVMGKLTEPEYLALLKNSEIQRIDVETFNGLTRLYGYVADGSCSMLGYQAIHMIGNALLKNETVINDVARLNQVRNSVYLIKSDLFLKQGNVAFAIKALDEVYAVDPQTGIPLRQAYFSIQASQWQMADHYLAVAEESDLKRNPLIASRQPDIQALKIMLREQRQVK